MCDNTDTNITIHVGEAIDWDIPDSDGGSANDCGADASRQIVWQNGTGLPPETNYYGSLAFCGNIPGAIVVDNETWVDPNSGYSPAELGGLPASHSGFAADCPEPGLTCYCEGYRSGGRASQHVYGTFRIENGRGAVEVIIWLDHPTQ